MSGVDQALTSVWAVILWLLGLIFAAIAVIETALRDLMARIGIPGSIQNVVLLIAAVLLIIAALRMFGGFFRILIVLFLILLAVHLLMPALHPG